MKSLKPVIFCAALIGAAAALVRPLEAQYIERFRAVVTDTNGVVVSHADIELATGEKLSSAVQPGASITNLTGYGTAAYADTGATSGNVPFVAAAVTLDDRGVLAWNEDPETPLHGLYSVRVETDEVPDGWYPGGDYADKFYPLVRFNSRDDFNAGLQTHILGWSRDAYDKYGATAYSADETRAFLGLAPTNDVTFGRVSARGITSTGANTNTAATVWRSSGNETKASIDNETGAVVVRGEDSDLRYLAGGFRVQNANLNDSALSSMQYAFLSPSASNLREVTIRWAMDTNSVHDGIVARIGPARSAGGMSQYIEIQLQTNSVITTAGTVRYYSQTFSTNYNGSASSAITAPGAWAFWLYNGSAGVATNLGAIVQIECASE